MTPFINENFMLANKTAVRLFHDFAKGMPIYDYHCHLSPQAMYEDMPFTSAAQVFLGGDHYKWRYMRSCGMDEGYITGDKSDYEKFRAFCSCIQYAAGNPLYHWTHLELHRYFGIDDVITEKTCDSIWKQCGDVIDKTQMSPAYLINRSNVRVICTTDDPLDTLEYHDGIRQKGHISAKVLPAFRPDFLLNIDKDTFVPYMRRLADICGKMPDSYDGLIDAVYSRIEYFHRAGCRISDHALLYVPYAENVNPDAVFKKVMGGGVPTKEEADGYKSAFLSALGAKYAELGWTMQLHIGALRNNNTRMFERMGADTGFDSIADYPVAEPLSRLMDSMDRRSALPKTILYSLNPADNYVIASMLGNFQSAECAGKIQMGCAWWFNDQRDGMTEHLKALANLGALSGFVGMLTDSRSFLSYTRHEYFRRILCTLIGSWVENGEFPADYELLGHIIKGICFENAEKYFGIEI